MIKENLLYSPFYCEEKFWYLYNNPDFADFEKLVVIISNVQKKCVFYSQKLSSQNNHIPIIWNYHVILLVKWTSWLVYDFDTILPFPIITVEYTNKTSKNINSFMQQPKFRLISATDYIKEFSSDRSHMLQIGKWIHQPPIWNPIINKKFAFAIL